MIQIVNCLRLISITYNTNNKETGQRAIYPTRAISRFQGLISNIVNIGTSQNQSTTCIIKTTLGTSITYLLSCIHANTNLNLQRNSSKNRKHI